ncbi:hypothetical protein D3C77_461310 [compost metagenome]
MVCSDFWLSRRNDGQQRGFSYARKSDQTYISHHLQLKYNPALLSFFSVLGQLRGWIARRGKTDVTAPSASASGYDNLLPMSCQIRQHLLRIIIDDNRPRRNPYNHIVRIGAMLTLISPLHAALCLKVPLITKIHQRSQTFVNAEDDISALTAISARRTAFRDVFLAPESYDAVAAVTAFNVYFRFIYKHAFTLFINFRITFVV